VETFKWARVILFLAQAHLALLKFAQLPQLPQIATSAIPIPRKLLTPVQLPHDIQLQY